MWTAIPPRLLALCAVALLPVVTAAQSISGVGPSPVAADSVASLTISGTNLLLLDTFQIRKGASGTPRPLSIFSQTATTVVCTINLAVEPVGLYDVLASGPSVSQFAMADALEVTRPGGVLISRPTTTLEPYPFTSGLLHTNTEVLYLQSEIGRPANIARLRFYLNTGTPALSGTVLVRMKHSASATFASNQLENTGWTTFYNGAIPTPAVDGTFDFPAQSIFSYDGVNNLVVSLVHDTAAAAFGDYLIGWDTGTDRLRAGFSNSGSPSADTWSGTTPSLRTLRQRVPKMEIRTTDLAATADFSTGTPVVTLGTPISFTDASSSPLTGRAWDFNRDGVTDSTAVNPSHNYAAAGIYSVELIVTNGYAQDSRTRVGYVEVQPGSGVADWSLLAEE